MTTADAHQYYWWMKDARETMASLVTQMGLTTCPVCDGASLQLLPWPSLIAVGGLPWREKGEPHRGNLLFMALVRCELCGYSMSFDSERLTGKDQPPIWGGPGP